VSSPSGAAYDPVDADPEVAPQSPPPETIELEDPPLLSLLGEAESIQQRGIEGKNAAKHYLESTTRISLSWNAYEDPFPCTLLMLDGSHQRFDMRGRFFESRHEVFVEVKYYGAAGNQSAAFDLFLAQAYSATAKQWQELTDPKYHFFWVTWHPFGTVTNWSKLESEEQIKAALTTHSSLLSGQAINPEVLRTVAGRIWLLVLHRKYKELTPAPGEIGRILLELGRH
jgi:hypothetical protein